jgi:hypothetical protein
LRLDCHPTLVAVYESLGFKLVDVCDMSAKAQGPMMVARLQRLF